jgi:hypothetical protein
MGLTWQALHAGIGGIGENCEGVENFSPCKSRLQGLSSDVERGFSR